MGLTKAQTSPPTGDTDLESDIVYKTSGYTTSGAMLGSAGVWLPTFPLGHHSKQHHCCHQQAQQDHSAPDQGDAEGHKGIGELRTGPGRKLLTRNSRAVEKGAVLGEPWLQEEELGDGMRRTDSSTAEEKHIIRLSWPKTTRIKGSLLNWDTQAGLPDFLSDQRFPRGGRNHEVSP